VAVAWGMLVLIFNLGDAINSAAHLWGSRPYDEPHQARNLPVLGFLALGEGWHANHHTFPSSARHGLLPGQFDFAWCAIRVFQWLGLARDVRVPAPAQVEVRKHPSTATSPIRVSFPP
jgi:fatty-acid desaturase